MKELCSQRHCVGFKMNCSYENISADMLLCLSKFLIGHTIGRLILLFVSQGKGLALWKPPMKMARFVMYFVAAALEQA